MDQHTQPNESNQPRTPENVELSIQASDSTCPATWNGIHLPTRGSQMRPGSTFLCGSCENDIWINSDWQSGSY
jgi:hypothetical protein